MKGRKEGRRRQSGKGEKERKKKRNNIFIALIVEQLSALINRNVNATVEYSFFELSFCP